MGAVLKRVLKRDPELNPPTTDVGLGDWNDLSGLLLPASEELRLVNEIKDGTLSDVNSVVKRFRDIDNHYREYQWAWTYRMILDYYHLDELTLEDAERIHSDYITARRSWIAEIRKDAEKEYAMGDVEEDVFQNFIDSLDHEVDFEE